MVLLGNPSGHYFLNQDLPDKRICSGLRLHFWSLLQLCQTFIIVHTETKQEWACAEKEKKNPENLTVKYISPVISGVESFFNSVYAAQ